KVWMPVGSFLRGKTADMTTPETTRENTGRLFHRSRPVADSGKVDSLPSSRWLQDTAPTAPAPRHHRHMPCPHHAPNPTHRHSTCAGCIAPTTAERIANPANAFRLSGHENPHPLSCR